ncbi:MAG TPA: metal-dependent transcriptional regulator [Elusimicrobiota bacterium]|nr:metal-dependent transcriptional regulator [Elusimicrobiota bacterium]
MITPSREDYLETLFHLESEGVASTTQAIADHLQISAASVSENIKKMAIERFVVHSPYKGVKLTAKGRAVAIDVVRRHRLSERFLVDKLGIKWEEAHREAHRLEHGLSRAVEVRMFELLGNPETCPHGNPVPTLSGKIRDDHSHPLASLNVHDRARIVKITDEEPKQLRYLASIGLMPKTQIRVERKAPFGGAVIVRVGETAYALGNDIARSIWVRKTG